MVYRLYVEKKKGFTHEASGLLSEATGLLGIKNLENVRIVNRYDVGKGHQYETRYEWLHKFCCWALEFEYEKEHHGDHDDSFKVYYYFYNL